jgi:hypothetical protein
MEIVIHVAQYAINAKAQVLFLLPAYLVPPVTLTLVVVLV